MSTLQIIICVYLAINLALLAFKSVRKIRFIAIILVVLPFTGCVQKQANSCLNEQAVDSISQQKPNVDSLLNTILRPSQMKLPMVWMDAIYDTCFTNWSCDGKYAVFVGRTEEDKLLRDRHLTCYGILSMDERNSIFLYDAEENTLSLLMTTSPEGFGLYQPKIDMKHEWVYYFRENGATTMRFMRYNFKTKEEELLTDCHYQVIYDIKPNGNILLQYVREDVCVWDSTVFMKEEDAMTGWLGYLFSDIEMSPSGVCRGKSKFYTYFGDDRSTKTYDIEDWGIINNKNLQHKWIDSLRETRYFNKKGKCVGVTNNLVESYDGWNGAKQMDVITNTVEDEMDLYNAFLMADSAEDYHEIMKRSVIEAVAPFCESKTNSAVARAIMETAQHDDLDLAEAFLKETIDDFISDKSICGNKELIPLLKSLYVIYSTDIGEHFAANMVCERCAGLVDYMVSPNSDAKEMLSMADWRFVILVHAKNGERDVYSKLLDEYYKWTVCKYGEYSVEAKNVEAIRSTANGEYIYWHRFYGPID